MTSLQILGALAGSYLICVDGHGVFGLENVVPMTGSVESNAIVTLVPKTGQTATVRISYLIGYFARST